MAELEDYSPISDESVPIPHATETCSGCGSPVDQDDSFCNYCGTELHAEAPDDKIEERHAKYFRCNNCGSEVSTDFDTRSYICPFCDSTYVAEFAPDASGRQEPEFVIGFAISKEKSQQLFTNWIASNKWYHPGKLEAAKVVEKLKGIYIPFWSFTMLAHSEWSASIGEHWYKTERVYRNGKWETKRVRHTEWWPLSGKHHRFYTGYLLSGSRGIKQQHADRIKPFHLANLHRYQPKFLAGWLCEEYSIERDEALEKCESVFRNQEQKNIGNFLPGDTHNQLQSKTDFSSRSSDLILLPVYTLAYEFEKKKYHFYINGQTGRIAGDKPVSNTKIGAAVAVGAAVLILIIILVNLFG